MTRYLSGLCVAGLGLCAGGWLIVATKAFGGHSGGDARQVNLATGAGLILVSAASLAAWALAWRRRLRADGVLAASFHPVSRRAARRNRRRLAREVRHSAWMAKRAARRDRRRGGPAVPFPPLSGPLAAEPAEAGPALTGAVMPGLSTPGAGHDGASSADVLSELRALPGPLLTAATNPLGGDGELRRIGDSEEAWW